MLGVFLNKLLAFFNRVYNLYFCEDLDSLKLNEKLNSLIYNYLYYIMTCTSFQSCYKVSVPEILGNREKTYILFKFTLQYAIMKVKENIKD